jgi:hypothetical protein
MIEQFNDRALLIGQSVMKRKIYFVPASLTTTPLDN